MGHQEMQRPKTLRGRSRARMAALAVQLIVAALALDGCRPQESARRERVTLSYFRLGWSQPDEGPAAQRLSEDFTRQTGIGLTQPPVPETSLSQLDLSRKLVREGDPTSRSSGHARLDSRWCTLVQNAVG